MTFTVEAERIIDAVNARAAQPGWDLSHVHWLCEGCQTRGRVENYPYNLDRYRAAGMMHREASPSCSWTTFRLMFLNDREIYRAQFGFECGVDRLVKYLNYREVSRRTS